MSGMMQVHYGYENLILKTPVVTLGTFDGVHRGHKVVIDSVVRKAKEVKGESVIITFYPHPRKVLSGSAPAMAYLTTREEKEYLMEKCGVDHLIVIGFDQEFSNREACDFVEDVLIRKIGAAHLVVGFNHRFGRRGEGDFETIRSCAAKYGLTVEMIGALDAGSRLISSSAIRDALKEGKLDEANNLLGYSYMMNGTIVTGKKIGRSIGYPTANIKPGDQEKLVPGNGVYAVDIIIEGVTYKGVMSIGFNPTVNPNSAERTIEANIFDFDRDIYGAAVTVIFRFRLRDEMAFNSLAELAAQIELDKKSAMGLPG